MPMMTDEAKKQAAADSKVEAKTAEPTKPKGKGKGKGKGKTELEPEAEPEPVTA